MGRPRGAGGAAAAAAGLSNVRIVTADMNELEYTGVADRIVSVEMFEHMRNYAVLFERIARWLGPHGTFTAIHPPGASSAAIRVSTRTGSGMCSSTSVIVIAS